MRFAGIFRDTWRKIPLRARRWMMAHWRNNDGKNFGYATGVWRDRVARHCPVPRIQLLGGWEKPSSDVVYAVSPYPNASRSSGRNFGVSFARGFLLRFWAPAVDKMPPEVAMYLVAHELAHVVQDANGFRPDNNEELEEDADLTIAQWDFGEPELFDDWSVEAGYSRRVSVATFEEYLAYREANPDKVRY